jgi:hypothetical protein
MLTNAIAAVQSSSKLSSSSSRRPQKDSTVGANRVDSRVNFQNMTLEERQEREEVNRISRSQHMSMVNRRLKKTKIVDQIRQAPDHLASTLPARDAAQVKQLVSYFMDQLRGMEELDRAYVANYPDKRDNVVFMIGLDGELLPPTRTEQPGSVRNKTTPPSRKRQRGFVPVGTDD